MTPTRRRCDQTDVWPIDQPDVDIDPAGLAEGQAISFTATVPVRPDVELGAYTGYPFALEVHQVTDEQVDGVIEELRDQQATLRPIDGRPAANGDIASVKFAGTIGGEPFDGGAADRLPIVIGENRMIPGWEENLVGMEIGAGNGFDITFPDDYRVEELRGKEAHFDVELLDLRERLLPEVTDEFAKSVSDVETVDALRAEIRDALEQRSTGEARQPVRRPNHRLRHEQRQRRAAGGDDHERDRDHARRAADAAGAAAHRPRAVPGAGASRRPRS